MSIHQSGPHCDICGGVIFLDKSINPFRVVGIGQDLHCHDSCKEVLLSVGKDWTLLPNGPLRAAFEAASCHQEEVEESGDEEGK